VVNVFTRVFRYCTQTEQRMHVKRTDCVSTRPVPLKLFHKRCWTLFEWMELLITLDVEDQLRLKIGHYTRDDDQHKGLKGLWQGFVQEAMESKYQVEREQRIVIRRELRCSIMPSANGS
jgi:hypothetical protein